MQLTQASSRAVLDFLREIYASTDLDQFAHQVASQIAKLIPSDIASYNEYEIDAARMRYVAAPAEVDLPGLSEAFERHMAEHPFVSHYARTGSERALKLSDFLTRPQFHRLGLYGEFYRRVETEFLLGLRFTTRPPVNIALAVCRRLRDFTEHEQRLLELLRPHLAQAYQQAEAAGRIRAELAETKVALEALDRGLIVLTREGRVRLQTARATQLVAAWFAPPPWRAGDLPELIREWLGRPSLARAPLVIDRQSKRLVVRLLEAEGRLLLLLEEQWTVLPAESLEPLGLSRREAQVLAWAAEGKSDEAIATILGVSFRTVKKHLEHVYAKLGVEGRTAAAAVAHRAAPSSH
jgi:DNA-binding CsgD family transcriptional regulator